MRGKRLSRFAIGCGIAIMLCSLQGAAHAETSTATYVNATYHYSFSYPATWTKQHIAGADIRVGSADNAHFVLAVGTSQKVSQSDLSAGGMTVLRKAGGVTSKPVVSTVVIHGIRYQETAARLKTAHNIALAAWVLVGQAHGRSYAFAALDVVQAGTSSGAAGTVTAKSLLPTIRVWR